MVIFLPEEENSTIFYEARVFESLNQHNEVGRVVVLVPLQGAQQINQDQLGALALYHNHLIGGCLGTLSITLNGNCPKIIPVDSFMDPLAKDLLLEAARQH